MDDLTPEAVKDMMHHHEKGRAENDKGFTRLELNSLALARDWLRLKKVEAAGEVLAEDVSARMNDLGGYDGRFSITKRLAAFRAAVEGK